MKRILEIFIATCLVLALAVGTWLLVDADSFENIFIKNEQNTPSTDEQQPINPDAPTPDSGGGEEQPLVCIITFKDDAKTLLVVNIANGALITSPSDPVKEGYIFLGWAIEGTNSPADFTSLIASTDMTFIALWEKENKVTPASSFTFDGNTITGYFGDDTEVIIPASYSFDSEGNPIDGEDIQVTKVDKIFYSSTTIKSVVIPEGITSVGSFSSSTIEEVTLPSTLTSIGLFQNCSNLKKITIPDSVKSLSSQIFQGCTSLEEVILPNTLLEIPSTAFWGCTSLTSITIPDSVLSIKGDSFVGSGLTSITIPDSVTNIATNPFRECQSLTSIIVGSENSKYDSRNNCNAIIETATNTLVTGCQNTIIPDGVTSIGSYAFQKCIGLTSITIPNGVTSIGDNAFYDCRNLTKVTIPASVTSLGKSVFNCPQIKIIIAEGSTPATIGDKPFYTYYVTIYVPNDAVDIYKEAWPTYAEKIKPLSEYTEAE